LTVATASDARTRDSQSSPMAPQPPSLNSNNLAWRVSPESGRPTSAGPPAPSPRAPHHVLLLESKDLGAQEARQGWSRLTERSTRGRSGSKKSKELREALSSPAKSLHTCTCTHMPARLKAWPHESSRQRHCKARPGGNQKSLSTIQSFRRRALESDVVWRGGGVSQSEMPGRRRLHAHRPTHRPAASG